MNEPDKKKDRLYLCKHQKLIIFGQMETELVDVGASFSHKFYRTMAFLFVGVGLWIT